MNQKDKMFLNPTIRSPWTTTAPRTVLFPSRKRPSLDENNNAHIKQARPPTVTRFVGRNEQVRKEFNPNLIAHTGPFHRYNEEMAKGSLLEKQLTQQKTLELKANVPQMQQSPNQTISNEVIEISDSPTKEDPFESPFLWNCLQSPKSDLGDSQMAKKKFDNYFAPMQFLAGPESMRTEHDFTPNFNAHSGSFHQYYEVTKRNLIEQQLRQEKALKLDCNFAQKQEFPKQIEITNLSMKQSNSDPLGASFLQNFGQMPNYVDSPTPTKRFKFENYFAPMQFATGPESLRSFRHQCIPNPFLANSDKNNSAVEGTDKIRMPPPSRVGIVIRKKERSYVSRLL